MEAIIAQPRGFCAGVVRAIDIVESALEIYHPPVYVLHEIVHNQYVVKDLTERGAVFVEQLEAVPDGALVIFSAHGVAAAIVAAAQHTNLQIIDATCPLVAKVHLEVARHAREGREVVLIGHRGHPEVVGTLGHYHLGGGGGIYLLGSVEEVDRLNVIDPGNLAYVTQTTLSVDDTARIVAALKQRFPAITGPRHDDICYATQNRQNAVRQLVGQVDLLLVVGARNSSNSNRLRELGEQLGLPAYLVQDADDLNAAWFREGIRVGLTAGASAPEVLVQRVLEKLHGLGLSGVTEMAAEAETISFRLPAGLVHKQGRPAH
ncbi:MAG TPA: 4-hydroxy-3-methylbut-2-enyl diphosphate reductase [Candidatus Competibacteraceae bacterium]|nr:4-hydroxy-3-methylbut-2-enyl diphosphate reductase [Candidatus Competibacteraceae bacterium]